MKRKKMLKRFLSFILCFAMLLSAISGAVFADYYEVINDTLANPTLYGSVYANEKYIFVGEGGSIYYSINATQWTKQPIVTNNTLNDIILTGTLLALRRSFGALQRACRRMEQGGTRPSLILQNDIGNRHSPTTIVAAITGRKTKAALPTHVAIMTSGLKTESTVLLEQIRTIDKARLGEYIHYQCWLTSWYQENAN